MDLEEASPCERNPDETVQGCAETMQHLFRDLFCKN